MSEVIIGRSSAGEMWETRSVFQGGSIAVIPTAGYGCELCRRAVGQRRMRAMMVVIMQPDRQLAASISEAKEHLHVQALIAQSSVEAFDMPFSTGRPGGMKSRCTPFK